MKGTRPDGTLKTDIVFIYGALRSGTTVFKAILKAHPRISHPGEADFLFDHIRSDPTHPTGWRYDLDGLTADRIRADRQIELTEGLDGLDLLADMLAQFRARAPKDILAINLHRNAVRFHQVLPRARVIHMLRDPRDVARSSIGMGWAGTVYHGVGHWIRTETEWDRIADDLPSDLVMTLRYETLFTQLEPTLREVCEFLGTVYEPEMQDYRASSRYAPPDASLVDQWRRLLSPREIALVESRAGNLMRARGYAYATDAAAPRTVEKMWLSARNFSVRWQFRIERFGLRMALIDLIARKAGLSRLGGTIEQNMNEITRHNLK